MALKSDEPICLTCTHAASIHSKVGCTFKMPDRTDDEHFTQPVTIKGGFCKCFIPGPGQ